MKPTLQAHEIEPCPDCGSTALAVARVHLIGDASSDTKAECKNCGLEMRGRTEDELRVEWNRQSAEFQKNRRGPRGLL